MNIDLIYYICTLIVSAYLYVSFTYEIKIFKILLKLISCFVMVISIFKIFWPIILADLNQLN